MAFQNLIKFEWIHQYLEIIFFISHEYYNFHFFYYFNLSCVSFLLTLSTFPFCKFDSSSPLCPTFVFYPFKALGFALQAMNDLGRRDQYAICIYMIGHLVKGNNENLSGWQSGKMTSSLEETEPICIGNGTSLKYPGSSLYIYADEIRFCISCFANRFQKACGVPGADNKWAYQPHVLHFLEEDKSRLLRKLSSFPHASFLETRHTFWSCETTFEDDYNLD